MKNVVQSVMLTALICSMSLSTKAEDFAQASAAGFDCAAAATTIEKRICASPALSALDLKLSQVYTQAQSETAGVNGETGERIDPLAQEQKKWIAKRNQCKTNTCLKNAYQKRIQWIQTHWLAQ